jgi:hypothetical protein
MAMPQRDDTIEAIKRLEPPSRVCCGASGALLEHAVMHGDEAERIREERTGGCVGFAEGCGGRGASALPARGWVWYNLNGELT